MVLPFLRTAARRCAAYTGCVHSQCWDYEHCLVSAIGYCPDLKQRSGPATEILSSLQEVLSSSSTNSSTTSSVSKS